jgi:hypothetical protein
MELAEAMAGAAHLVAGTAESVEGQLTPANPPASADKPAKASKFSRFRRKKGKR